MYAQHFGLEHEPFSIAPDPRYLYLGERHREALAHLRYGLDGGGLVLLTGEIGSGKTTLCRCFLEQLPADCIVAYIFNPQLTVRELLATICDEFGVRSADYTNRTPSIKSFIDPLNRFLLEAHAAGSICLLVIDEAQALSTHVLEQLRLLTNLETAHRKLLQIVLVGQPELRTRLADPALEQLAQRVIARYHLGPLAGSDIGRYIEHRLMVAGLRGPNPFPTRLLPDIERLSGGIPRRINRLCDRALLGAFAQGRHEVDRATLRQAAREVGGGRPAAPVRGHRRRLPGAVAMAVGLGVALSLVAAWSAWRPQSLPVPTGEMAATATSPGIGAAASGPSLIAASAASAAAAPITLAELRTHLREQPLGEQQAWQRLVDAWQPVDLGADGACRAAARVQLGCFRGRGGVALIRQLDRPGILLLDEPAGARLVLVGLGSDEAWLRIDGRIRRLPLIDLARVWSGDFATFWRVPEPLLRPAPADGSEPLARWIAQRLGGAEPRGDAPARIDAPLRRKLIEFQRAQGLETDGVPGPMTLMALNRASGVTEPRLEDGR